MARASKKNSKASEKGKEAKKKNIHYVAGIDAFKKALAEAVNDFKNDLDPKKLAALKREAIIVLKKITAGAALVLLISALLIAVEIYYDGKVAPRTNIAGLSLGSVELAKAKNDLVIEINRFMKTPIIFIYGDHKIAMTPEELGVKPDLDKTMASIPMDNFTKTSPLVLAASLLTTRDLPLAYTLDYESAAAKVGEKLGLNQYRAKNARLARADSGFMVEAEKAGYVIDKNKFIALVRSNVSSLKSNPIIINTNPEIPRVTAEDLEKEKPRLEALLKNNVLLKSDKNKQVFKPLEHLDAIEYQEKTTLEIKNLGLTLPVEMGNEEGQITPESGVKLVSKIEVKINPNKALPYLREKMLNGLETPVSSVTITRQADGKINLEGKGEDGKRVDEIRLIAAMEQSINRGIGAVRVPVINEKAPVIISDELRNLGIKELLATGHSSFYGSHANRIHNINVGIAKYNGVLIKPGEEFSFNQILGEVDAAHGYLPEKVIKQNKVETEYGGGICQVSSTLYRAALIAGLPITERKPHSWLVPYYGQVLGPGLDATIYLGVSDLKFINDTPANILIQSYTDGMHAYFKFYGTSDGRAVKLDGPYGGGLHYKWLRTVTKNGQTTT
jgi:vancomycin resistance protein YoaR